MDWWRSACLPWWPRRHQDQAPAVGLPAMAMAWWRSACLPWPLHHQAPAPSSASSNRRRSRPSSPTASSPAFFPPRKMRMPRRSPRRSGRPPPFMGLATYAGFFPAWDPHRAPSAAERFPFAKHTSALTRKADFEYDFVPCVPEEEADYCAWGWFPLDARDGRVLIQSKYFPEGSGEFPDGGDSRRPRFMNYAVCDPLFKRYRLLPPIPDDLTVDQGSLVNFGLCLAPSQEDEADTSFRVICVVKYKTELVVFVFSSFTRQWEIATSSNWTSSGTEAPPDTFRPTDFYGLGRFDYVDGCFYWTEPSEDKILVLDALNMELSVINYAHSVEYGYRVCIAVDTEGDPGMLTVGEYLDDRQFRLSCIAKQSDHESPNERLSENTIQLPSYHDGYFTLGAAEGFIFLRGYDYEEDPYKAPEGIDYYSLNVKTAEFVRVCEMNLDNCYNRVCPYFRFSPPWAKPCV